MGAFVGLAMMVSLFVCFHRIMTGEFDWKIVVPLSVLIVVIWFFGTFKLLG